MTLQATRRLSTRTNPVYAIGAMTTNPDGGMVPLSYQLLDAWPDGREVPPPPRIPRETHATLDGLIWAGVALLGLLVWLRGLVGVVSDLGGIAAMVGRWLA